MIKSTPKILSILLLLTFVFSSVIIEAAPSPDETKSEHLKWKNGIVNIALSSSFFKTSDSIPITGGDISGAVNRSLATWERAADIKFNLISTDKQAASPVGKVGDGVSLITIAPIAENIQLFNDDASEVSAKTRVFYNRKGYITEADIVLNPYVQFSTDGTFGTFDLEATLTHEIGHLLGLEHSSFCGSTMHTHQAKNGIYNLSQTSARTLSESDIANIRAIYGAADVENCCGSVKGKLSLPANVAAGGFQIWLENPQNGKVQAGDITKPDGTFNLEGITAGRYRIFAQDSGEKQKNRKKIYAGEDLGEVTIENGKVAAFDKEITPRERTFSLKYIGSNGQLSNVPVPVNGGKMFTIYLGGENLNLKDYKITINSPLFKIEPENITTVDFGDEVSVLRFNITTQTNLPLGEYTISVQKNNGEKAFIVGALTSDFLINPGNTAITNLTK